MPAELLQQILNRIYVLPLSDLMLFGMYAAVICRALYDKYRLRSWWRPCCGAALVLWAVAVLWITLLSRRSGSAAGLRLIPLDTYWTALTDGEWELVRSAFMNVLLFFPAGLLCAGLVRRERSMYRVMLSALPLFGLFSLGIELAQFLLRTGMTETDDVLHNVLGAALGIAAFQIRISET